MPGRYIAGFMMAMGIVFIVVGCIKASGSTIRGHWARNQVTGRPEGGNRAKLGFIVLGAGLLCLGYVIFLQV